MPPSNFLAPKPPSLLRVSESQAISNSSSFISSASTSSLFDRISDASSGYLTDISSPFTPSTAEFGNTEEVGVAQPSDSPTTKQVSPAGERGRHDHALFSPQSRLPRRTNVSLINRSSRLDRACALGSGSSSRSYSQKGTPFLSLIPISVAMNEDRRYHLDSEDTFDAITILRNRLEQGTPTVATRRALEIMDPDGHPPAACLNESIGGAVEAPITVVVTAPDSPVEDWSSDFDLGSATDVKVCPEPSHDVNTIVDQLSDSDSSMDGDWLNALEIAAAHSTILFPSVSDRSLLDEIEQDTVSSPMPSESFRELPSKPVLEPVISDSPCSPFILGTPDLSSNWEGSYSPLSTLMAESPPSPISSPANMSIDDDEMARIMRAVLSIPTRSRQPFTGSPHGDVDPATVMHLAVASTFPADHTHPHASQPRTLIGLGVAMPVIHPPLPPTLFPFHHPPGPTLSSRSLRDLGYQSFDDKMFEIEQASWVLSRNINRLNRPENVETDLSGLDFEIHESPHYSPLEGCTALTLPLPQVDSECSGAFRVEQALTIAQTALHHGSPIIFGKILVGLGVSGLTDASVESQLPPTEPSPTTGRHLVSADESITEVDVAVAPLSVSDFYCQIQNSTVFEPVGAQNNIELDASQLERQSALYNLEHTDLLLEHMFPHSSPIQIEKRTEIERQLLAGLSKKESFVSPLFRNPLFSSPALSLRQDYSVPCTLKTDKHVGVEQPPRSIKQSADPDERSIFSKRSYQALKSLGLERLAIFQPRSGRDDLDLTLPTVTPQDDPRSPYQSTLKRVFLTFSSINPTSEMHSSMKRATTSTGFDINQSSGSVLPMNKENHPESGRPSKSMRIGLGLPSHLALRRSRLQETYSQGSIDAVRCQSRSSSQECQNPCLVVTEPSFASSRSRVQSAESSNQFLKPSHFVQRPLYDIVEVPTPPSSTSSSPRGTPSSRNQWSSPFSPLHPPRKRHSPRSQLSTPSTGSPLTESPTHADAEVGAVDINVVPESPEAPMSSLASARPGFKRFVSKFTRGVFKRSRSKTSSLVVSPVLIEHEDAPQGLGILRQDNHGASCGTKENGFTSYVHQLQLLF